MSNTSNNTDNSNDVAYKLMGLFESFKNNQSEIDSLTEGIIIFENDIQQLNVTSKELEDYVNDKESICHNLRATFNNVTEHKKSLEKQLELARDEYQEICTELSIAESHINQLNELESKDMMKLASEGQELIKQYKNYRSSKAELIVKGNGYKDGIIITLYQDYSYNKI